MVLARSNPTLGRAEAILYAERRGLERMRHKVAEARRALDRAQEEEERCDNEGDEAARHREQVICPDFYLSLPCLD